MIYVSDIDPLKALSSADEPGTLAIITSIEGPSYRPLGAMMAILADDSNVGTLSSGCIESDLLHHAEQAKSKGEPITVRYGNGSPFIDIQLPCGGTLEITLIYAPDQAILRQVITKTRNRSATTLQINCDTGSLSFSDKTKTERNGEFFHARIIPELRFLVFGKGPEALTFTSLVRTASFDSLLLSPDRQMIEYANNIGCGTFYLTKPEFPKSVEIDEWTAILLFFHDHDWEPPILKNILSSPAFYIGAQGSKRARQTLLNELTLQGSSSKELANLQGPIGLIPSTRDSRTLAISVLAEVLLKASVFKPS
ncbi:XdhC family protein [Lentilitoribacter sp. Alg239-R112]|uniref:XdhC family protein n=1 Tax=Lentilitoribacter sp. Alg239-R112 TaxID=2305987 RepID=UPI0013A6D9F0|nr:XdhC family protein [Lentilitoribacter sp. Alg239-R112]